MNEGAGKGELLLKNIQSTKKVVGPSSMRVRVRVNDRLPKKTARIPFSILGGTSVEYAKISYGEVRVLVRVDGKFDGDDVVEVDEETYGKLCGMKNDDIDCTLVQYSSLPIASFVRLRVVGPIEISDLTTVIMGYPFARGEVVNFLAHTIYVEDADEDEFVVGPMTRIESNFVQTSESSVDVLKDVYAKILHSVEVVKKRQHRLGILVIGGRGTGKTYFMKKLASSLPTEFSIVTVKDVNEGKKFLSSFQKTINEAMKENKIVIMDDLDLMISHLPDLVPLLTSVFDAPRVPLIIGTVSDVSRIPQKLLSPHRFGVRIRTRYPTLEERIKVIQSMGAGFDDITIRNIAKELEGYSMGDVYRFVTTLLIEVHSRSSKGNRFSITPEVIRNHKKKNPPSDIMVYRVEVPNVHWSDIGGLNRAKKELQKAVEWPLKYPELFRKMKLKSPHGVLLYGPPGTGKTLLAKAVATESGANFIAVKAPEILDKYYGVSEERIRNLFERARASKPTIIFIDEIDAIGILRNGKNQGINSIINQLLTEMDGISDNDGITVIATTNRIDVIDPALLRPGRFEKKIYVPLPDVEARKEIFRIHLKNKPVSDDVNIDVLPYYMEDMSGADIEAVVRNAAYRAIERSIREGSALEITMNDLMEAIKEIGNGSVINGNDESGNSDKRVENGGDES